MNSTADQHWSAMGAFGHGALQQSALRSVSWSALKAFRIVNDAPAARPCRASTLQLPAGQSMAFGGCVLWVPAARVRSDVADACWSARRPSGIGCIGCRRPGLAGHPAGLREGLLALPIECRRPGRDRATRTWNYVADTGLSMVGSELLAPEGAHDKGLLCLRPCLCSIGPWLARKAH